MDKEIRPMAYDGCGHCGKVTLWISYQLLADMLKNCPESCERDTLIRTLKKMNKSRDLQACLNREKIWDLVDVYW